MKFSYIKNIPLSQGELSVVLAKDAEQLMRHSCELAEEMKQSGLGVLLINCGMSDRRFRRHAHAATSCIKEQATDLMPYRHEPGDESQIMLYSSVGGDLVGEADTIRALVAQCPASVVILAGWEWTSSSYRRKERLIYDLRELMRDQDVSVVVYSQATTKPELGIYDRGGIGKLAMLAVAIIAVTAANILEVASPKPKAIITTESDIEAAERSAQLLTSKINDLSGTTSLAVREERNSGKRERMKDKKPVKNEEKVLSVEV
ncbi:MAG: hypothetical protein ACHQM6_02270 [Candidatus Kapaibacterium sp.]